MSATLIPNGWLWTTVEDTASRDDILYAVVFNLLKVTGRLVTILGA